MPQATSNTLRGVRGISMIEVLAAVAIISGALIALMATRNANISRMDQLRKRFAAMRLAETRMNEILALLKSGEKKVRDFDGEDGEFEDRSGFRWESAISEAEIVDERGKEILLEGGATIVVKVFYKFDGEERFVSFSTVVSDDDTEEE